VADVTWLRPDGREMTGADWRRGDPHAIAVHLDGDGIAEPDAHGAPVRDDSILLLFNSHWEHVAFKLPGVAYGEHWRVAVDTADTADEEDAAGERRDGRLVASGAEFAAADPELGSGGQEFAAGESVKAQARSLMVLIRV
jgi:glycogen operon protein